MYSHFQGLQKRDDLDVVILDFRVELSNVRLNEHIPIYVLNSTTLLRECVSSSQKFPALFDCLERLFEDRIERGDVMEGMGEWNRLGASCLDTVEDILHLVDVVI